MRTVLALAGSARRSGNSDALLKAATDALRERGAAVETVVLSELDVRPCTGCGACERDGVCIIRDDLTDLYQKFLEVDHVLLASPIYFASLPGHVKVFIDRFQCIWARTFLLGQKPRRVRSGAFLCVGAMDRERYFRCAESIVRSWMAVLGMKCAASRFFPGVDRPGALASRHRNWSDQVSQAVEQMLEGA